MLSAGIVVLLGACGSAEANGATTTSAAKWALDVAEVDAPTMDELRARLDQEPTAPSDEHEAASIPADVFDNGDNRPDTGRPEWANLIGSICADDTSLLPLATSNGWRLRVTGYVDSRGPQGPGTLNDHLDEDRADAAALQIASDCGIDATTIETLGGDIHPDDIRAVVVSFAPDPDHQEEPQ